MYGKQPEFPENILNLVQNSHGNYTEIILKNFHGNYTEIIPKYVWNYTEIIQNTSEIIQRSFRIHQGCNFM